MLTSSKTLFNIYIVDILMEVMIYLRSLDDKQWYSFNDQSVTRVSAVIRYLHAMCKMLCAADFS